VAPRALAAGKLTMRRIVSRALRTYEREGLDCEREEISRREGCVARSLVVSTGQTTQPRWVVVTIVGHGWCPRVVYSTCHGCNARVHVKEKLGFRGSVLL